MNTVGNGEGVGQCFSYPEFPDNWPGMKSTGILSVIGPRPLKRLMEFPSGVV
jgi:hypothetical protein